MLQTRTKDSVVGTEIPRTKSNRRLFLEGVGTTVVPPLAAPDAQSISMRTVSKGRQDPVPIRLKRCSAFQDKHPVRKKSRVISDKERRPLTPTHDREIPPKPTARKTPSKNITETRTRKTPCKVERVSMDTPSKLAHLPIAGLVPRLAFVSAEQPSTGLYFLSPDAALRRPLKRTCSEQCIRQLTHISPQGKPSSPEIKTDVSPFDDEAGQGEEMFPTCKNVGRRKKAPQNFIKIDLKHKRFTRAAQKLKGAALKRLLHRKRTGFLRKK